MLLSTGLDIADMAWEQKCREEDMKQRQLENERRHIDDARRSVDEKAAQLKTIANQSALIAGFSMVALVEINIPSDLHPSLLVLYGAITALVVSLMLISMLNATYILVGILKYDTVKREIPFKEFWRKRCETDWRWTLRIFSLGIPMFMLSLSLAGWVVFWGHGKGGYVASALVSFIALVTMTFYLNLTYTKWIDWLMMSDTKIMRTNKSVVRNGTSKSVISERNNHV